MHNNTGFLLDQMWGLDCHGKYLSRELSGITTPHFAYGVQLWVNSLISLTGKQHKMKEHREIFPIPFFLQTSLSLSYLLHNSKLKELFGKALKCKNKKQEARRKNKLNRKKVEGKSLDSRVCRTIALVSTSLKFIVCSFFLETRDVSETTG